jgi:hypothetical protein
LDTEYDKGYKDAVDMFVRMIDDTLANQAALFTIPTDFILKLMRVSLLTSDDE